MKTHKSKISFNATPATHVPKVAQRIETKPIQKSQLDDGAMDKPMAAPSPTPTHEPPQPRSRLAAIGQFTKPEPSFLQRNGQMLGVVLVVGATFVLGLGTAKWLFGNDEPAAQQQATFSAPMTVPAFADTATRAVATDLTDVSDAILPSAAKVPHDENLTSAVLAGLRPTVAAPEQQQKSKAQLARMAIEIMNSNKLRMLREGVLARIYDIETFMQDGVSRVKLRTVNAPLTNKSASDALLAAVALGEIEMSTSLLTTNGGVDVDTMMFSLVQTSLRNDHDSEGTKAAREMSRKIFAASTVRTQKVNGNRVYVVQNGDCLAYLALQFFGDPNAYIRIMAANQDTLQTPDEIQIGQRLIIPS